MRPIDLSPLPHRMRPASLEGFIGQEHILGPGTPLRRWIEADQLPSLILWGPPGTGKTTLAKIIADKTHSRYEELNAISSGIKDIREIVARAKEHPAQKTLLFIDEIHRYSKSQQDTLLPHVENGTLTLIGATTEHPGFELNSALLSRARVIRLERLSDDSLRSILTRALEHPTRGLNGKLKLTDDAMTALLNAADGDARKALSILETLDLSVPAGTTINQQKLEEFFQSTSIKKPRYDRDAQEHHNCVSAFIKSMRASDPDAALYYLARMIEGGEDPIFIVRRMIIFASEDVGNADPRALPLATAALQAVEAIGMPEGRITLGHVASYLALCQKSRTAYDGIESALLTVRQTGTLEVPLHLRNVTSFSNPVSAAKNLPAEIGDKKFYRAKTSTARTTHQLP